MSKPEQPQSEIQEGQRKIAVQELFDLLIPSKIRKQKGRETLGSAFVWVLRFPESAKSLTKREPITIFHDLSEAQYALWRVSQNNLLEARRYRRNMDRLQKSDKKTAIQILTQNLVSQLETVAGFGNDADFGQEYAMHNRITLRTMVDLLVMKGQDFDLTQVEIEE